MANKVIDFDAWRRERDILAGEVELPMFRIGGKEYAMPAEPPATIALDVIRLRDTLKDGGDAAVPLGAFVKIGNAMFGEDVFREILEDNGVGAAEMGDLVLQAMGAWQHLDLDEEKAEARPNRQTRRRKPSTS